MACITVLVAGFAEVAGVEVQRLAFRRDTTRQRERRQVEVLLASQSELICRHSVQFLIGRHAEVDPGPALQSSCRMLHDGHAGEFPNGRAIISPAEPFRRICIQAVATEIETKTGIWTSGRVEKGLHVLSRTESELMRQVV